MSLFSLCWCRLKMVHIRNKELCSKKYSNNTLVKIDRNFFSIQFNPLAALGVRKRTHKLKNRNHMRGSESKVPRYLKKSDTDIEDEALAGNNFELHFSKKLVTLVPRILNIKMISHTNSQTTSSHR